VHTRFGRYQTVLPFGGTCRLAARLPARQGRSLLCERITRSHGHPPDSEAGKPVELELLSIIE